MCVWCLCMYVLFYDWDRFSRFEQRKGFYVRTVFFEMCILLMTDSDHPLVVDKTSKFTHSLQKMSSADTFGGLCTPQQQQQQQTQFLISWESFAYPLAESLWHTQRLRIMKIASLWLYLWWNSTNSTFISDVNSIHVSFFLKEYLLLCHIWPLRLL